MLVSSESDRWVHHSHAVLESLQDLRFALESVESSARGYVLTGEESYLTTYQASRLAVEQDQATVRELTVDNPAQQRQLPDLNQLATERIQLAEVVMGLRRSQGIAAAAAAIRSGSGQRIMEDFQAVIRTMQAEELRLLVQRDAEASRRLGQTKIALLFATVLGVLIAMGATWSVRSDSAARNLAEESRRESEKSFTTLANNISQLAWMADENGSIFWYNDRWLDYTGSTLAEMAGWGWQKVHHRDHVQRVVEKIRRCFQAGEIWEDTFPLRGRDGIYRLFSLAQFPSAIRKVRCSGGSAPTPTSARVKSQGRSTVVCWKRLPTPWWW